MTHTEPTAGRELTVTRLIDAPRERVWEAWTKPEHIARWWGPDGFTNTIHEMNVRPGGVWRYMMHGPDGTDYPNMVVYENVIEPELLEYDLGGEKDGLIDDPFHVVVTFEDAGGKTLLSMRSIFLSVEALEAVRKFGAVEGGEQTINHLAEYVRTMPF